ncbi:hypothetical protein [Pseudooceanicola aestuarii]|uniref:hypothetical protein n=1 Tax=Pseudooceanicola aestuarii TaxID=2697319 RepID=UPI0013D44F52|nr:hypothetical protein [Pseudooceanicola aestuarii]
MGGSGWQSGAGAARAGVMVVALVTALLALPDTMRAQDGAAVPPQGQGQNGLPKGQTKALRGNLVLFQGQPIHLAGMDCPDFSTEEGREAKFVITTMLRAPLVECISRELPGGGFEGDCFVRRNALVRARSMINELKARNLCLPFCRT